MVNDGPPALFTPFVNVSSEDQPLYTPAEDEASLRALLNAKLVEYNESNIAMDLVLFQQARRRHCIVAVGRSYTDHRCSLQRPRKSCTMH